MDVRIAVETVFEDGSTRKHEIGAWSRSFRKMSGEAIGLTLEDSKAILARLQKNDRTGSGGGNLLESDSK